MRRRSIGWLALVASTSCSLLTPLDGLSGGEARGLPDGSSPAVDGGTLSPAPRLCVDFSNGIVTSTGTPTSSSFERSDTIGAAPSTLELSTGQTSRMIAISPTMPSSRFATYAWSLDLGAGPKLSMSIDGSEALARAELLTFADPAHLTFIAGCTDYRTQASTVLWVDDVIVRF